MAPLNGKSFVLDPSEFIHILRILSQVIVLLSLKSNHTFLNNGRRDYIALRSHYEGIGVNLIDILKADSTFEKIVYQGEKKPHMWWDEFHIPLNFAFAAYVRHKGRVMHSDQMKLRVLTNKIQADFLAHEKKAIST